MPDIDIDFADRDLALDGLPHVPATIIGRNGRARHPSGVYFQNAPVHPLDGLCAFPHDQAGAFGYFKIDLLNNSIYAGVRSEDHLRELLNREVPWDLLEEPEVVETLAHIRNHFDIVQAIKPSLKIPFGVNYLWDPKASIAIATATGAKFVREIFTGVFASDMGVWAPDCAGAARLKRNLGRPDLKCLFNINAEFSHSLDSRPIELRAKSAVFSSLADAILVSGPITGQPVDQSNLRRVREAIDAVPVFANTGVNLDNVGAILALADGVVIGTHFKIDGDTWKAVDPVRVKRFMDAVAKLR